ncbi:MAG TPA: hypothetical protein PLE09_07385 [Caldisericia bacterium]|nr:hypothetical protein [Caldisericia bacterium]HXK52337.1 hypothetical protein [Caldisericia bacterium]
MSDIRYIKTIDEVIEIHKKTMEISGDGVDGILNLNSLSACLDQI